MFFLISVSLGQYVADLWSPVGGGFWSEPLIVFGISVGAAIDQNFDYLGLTEEDGLVERSSTLGAPDVEGGSALQELLHGGDVAAMVTLALVTLGRLSFEKSCNIARLAIKYQQRVSGGL